MAIILDNKRISESMPLDYTIERLGYDDFIKSIEEFQQLKKLRIIT